MFEDEQLLVQRSIIRRIIPIKLRYEGKVKGGTNLNRGKVHPAPV